MSDMATTLMDAAERRLRIGGFAAFSYRDLAAEVGIKSASVHYHFPTKENLVAAVLRRYTGHVAALIDEAHESEPDPVKVIAKMLASPVHSKDKLCPCIILGASIRDMAPEVQVEVRNFYQMWLDKMVAHGLTLSKATTVMATLSGAQLMALVMNDVKAYDDAAEEVLRENSGIAA